VSERRWRGAFAGEARAYALAAAAKAAWWNAAGAAAKALTKPTAEDARPEFTPQSDPPPAGFTRRAWREAFVKDAADVAAGLYPARDAGAPGPVRAAREAADFLADAIKVEARRRRRDGVEVRDEVPASDPAYYRQNFHYQSGGWFTASSSSGFRTITASMNVRKDSQSRRKGCRRRRQTVSSTRRSAPGARCARALTSWPFSSRAAHTTKSRFRFTTQSRPRFSGGPSTASFRDRTAR